MFRRSFLAGYCANPNGRALFNFEQQKRQPNIFTLLMEIYIYIYSKRREKIHMPSHLSQSHGVLKIILYFDCRVKKLEMIKHDC
jgi:hypothetical protein